MTNCTQNIQGGKSYFQEFINSLMYYIIMFLFIIVIVAFCIGINTLNYDLHLLDADDIKKIALSSIKDIGIMLFLAAILESLNQLRKTIKQNGKNNA